MRPLRGGHRLVYSYRTAAGWAELSTERNVHPDTLVAMRALDVTHLVNTLKTLVHHHGLRGDAHSPLPLFRAVLFDSAARVVDATAFPAGEDDSGGYRLGVASCDDGAGRVPVVSGGDWTFGFRRIGLYPATRAVLQAFADRVLCEGHVFGRVALLTSDGVEVAVEEVVLIDAKACAAVAHGFAEVVESLSRTNPSKPSKPSKPTGNGGK